MERLALKNEKDAASKDRLAKLEVELAGLQEQSDSMSAAWKAEKEKLAGSQKLTERLDAARSEVEVAQRKGDLARASQLLYGEIPELERKITANQDGGQLVNEAVTAEAIASVVSRWTGVPVDKMLEGERGKLLRMEDELRKRVVGQEDALKAVADAVRRARAGLQDPNRPIGSFLFLGPTGVGKTELTKALAGFLFDDERALLRVDMSEFMEKHAVSRLIGAPPGYVGYDEGGVLTEAVRRRPYQVILFDEVEKAHEDVFNVLLQVLDDGRLTDGQGRTVDFKNTIIVLTSNLGSEILAAQPDGADLSMAYKGVMEVVRGHFRPEFLNRLDEIVLFRRLQRSDMASIVDIQLRHLRALLADRKIGLELDRAAMDWLADEGYDPIYGARPLKRVIQRSLQNTLAGLILEGAVKDGETVQVTAGPAGLVINGEAGRIPRPRLGAAGVTRLTSWRCRACHAGRKQRPGARHADDRRPKQHHHHRLHDPAGIHGANHQRPAGGHLGDVQLHGGGAAFAGASHRLPRAYRGDAHRRDLSADVPDLYRVYAVQDHQIRRQRCRDAGGAVRQHERLHQSGADHRAEDQPGDVRHRLHPDHQPDRRRAVLRCRRGGTDQRQLPLDRLRPGHRHGGVLQRAAHPHAERQHHRHPAQEAAMMDLSGK